MQIETTEINGFAIDTFNQHGLEEGNKQGVCPLCSHNRKPKNQKAKCASYDKYRDPVPNHKKHILLFGF